MVSLKDYACLLENEFDITGSELPSELVLADILSDHVVKIKPHLQIGKSEPIMLAIYAQS